MCNIEEGNWFMPNTRKRLGPIIQFGSGKPGEGNSEAFERKLFKELGLEDPDIAFIPFHGLGSPPND